MARPRDERQKDLLRPRWIRSSIWVTRWRGSQARSIGAFSISALLRSVRRGRAIPVCRRGSWPGCRLRGSGGTARDSIHRRRGRLNKDRRRGADLCASRLSSLSTRPCLCREREVRATRLTTCDSAISRQTGNTGSLGNRIVPERNCAGRASKSGSAAATTRVGRLRRWRCLA
jgi:hypothetical protein